MLRIINKPINSDSKAHIVDSKKIYNCNCCTALLSYSIYWKRVSTICELNY